MSISRRDALTSGFGAVTLCGTRLVSAATAGSDVQCAAAADASGDEPIWRRDFEGRRRADLGTGRYLNPVLSGDHPDPTILKDGSDYYATFSSFDATPGLLIWHSRDLVNWMPVGAALDEPLGTVFASDLVKHGDRYYIYIPFIPAAWSQRLPASSSIFVIHANDIRGPWSRPVDLGIRGYIDPGHVLGEDGRRYLFLSGVARVRLGEDGLTTDGPIEHVYDGWQYPDDWVTEAYALEGPKLCRRGGWFYLISAVGGTSGPATGHMVIAARSRSVHGPWENCPDNPIVRTRSTAERWWSRGHATLLEGPGGGDWLVYHGYENGYRSLGRQMLLEPVTWGTDGWFRAGGGDLSRPLPMPAAFANPEVLPAWSDDFRVPAFGTRWSFFAAAPSELRRAAFEDGALQLQCKGREPADCTPLIGMSGDRAYECSVACELEGDAQAALLLFFNQRLFLGMGFDGERMTTYVGGTRSFWQEPAPQSRVMHLRIVNERQIVSFHYGIDGRRWTRHGLRSDVSGYHANTVADLQSLRPALCAIGRGTVRFSDYRYRGLA